MYMRVPDFSTPGKPYFEPEKTKHVTRRKAVILIAAVAVVVAAILAAKFFFIPERYGIGVSIITLPKSWKVTTETNECLQAVKGDAVLTLTARPAADALPKDAPKPTGELTLSVMEQYLLPEEGQILQRQRVALEDCAAVRMWYKDADGTERTGWWWVWKDGLYQLDLVGEDEEILEYIPRIRTANRSAHSSHDY